MNQPRVDPGPEYTSQNATRATNCHQAFTMFRARTRYGGMQVGIARSCGSVIFVDDSAEHWSSLDGHSQIDYSVWLVVGCLLLAALVRAMLVVMRLPLGEYVAEMSLVDDQTMS
jgi:hypothetical protein